MNEKAQRHEGHDSPSVGGADGPPYTLTETESSCANLEQIKSILQHSRRVLRKIGRYSQAKY